MPTVPLRLPPTNYLNLLARSQRIAVAFGFDINRAQLESFPSSHTPADIALILRAELWGVAGLDAAFRRPLFRQAALPDQRMYWCRRAVTFTALFHNNGETEFVLSIAPTPFALSWDTVRGLDEVENEPLIAPTMIHGLYCLGYRSGVEELSAHFNYALTDVEMAALALRMGRAGFSIPDWG